FGAFTAGGHLVTIDPDGYATRLSPGAKPGPFARSRGLGAAFSEDRKVLVLFDHDRLTLWDPDRGEHLLDVPVPSLAEDLAVSSDGLTLAVLGEEPAVLLIPLRPPLQGLPADGLARQ